nr:helix-turn-helix domain-containing protein [Bifidobacterium indicum]
MSWQATTWALREAPVGGDTTARLLLVALADRAHPDGSAAWPSVRTLTKELQISERTIRRKLAELEKAGVIRRGNQGLSMCDEHGHAIEARYRPVVWDLCMGVEPEPVAEVKKTRGDKLAPLQKGRNEADSEDTDNQGEDPQTRGDKLTPLTPGPETRGDTGGTPGVTPVADKPINNKPIPPLSPKGDISPGGAEPSNGHLLSTGLATLLESRHIPAPADSRRERQAARRLAARHGVDACLDLARWALDGPDGFWRPVIVSCKALDKHWTTLTLQRDRPSKSGQGGIKPPPDDNTPVKVTTALAARVPVYKSRLWHMETLRDHIDGEVELDNCPCCAEDERNREWHAVGLRRSQERRPEPEPTPKPEPWRQEWNFIGSRHNQ